MINSCFKLDYKLDRKELANMLKIHHSKGTRDEKFGRVHFSYKPRGGHSCVNIKHFPDRKLMNAKDKVHRTHIFVFPTNVIITGAKNLDHVIGAYKYVMKILKHYRSKIEVIEIDRDALAKDIAAYYKEKEKEKPKSKEIPLEKSEPKAKVKGITKLKLK